MIRFTSLVVLVLLHNTGLRCQAATTTVRLYRNDGSLDSNAARRAANQLVRQQTCLPTLFYADLQLIDLKPPASGHCVPTHHKLYCVCSYMARYRLGHQGSPSTSVSILGAPISGCPA